jgi:hypothetical protein
MGWPLIFAANKASTCRQMLSAVFLSTLPNRIVLRLPSGATNRIRRRPFGSFTMLAMITPSQNISTLPQRITRPMLEQ